jgi:hypothetical protein
MEHTEKAQELLSEFDHLLSSTHIQQSMKPLRNAQQQLHDFYEQEELWIDVLMFDNGANATIAQWLNPTDIENTHKFLDADFVDTLSLNIGERKLILQKQLPDGFPQQSIGKPQTPALICYVDASSCDFDDFAADYAKFSQNKAFLFLIFKERCDENAPYRKLATKDAWKAFTLYANKLEQTASFGELLQTAEIEDLHGLSNGSTALFTLDKLNQSYQLLVEQAIRELGAQQILTNQQENKLEGSSNKDTSGDVLSDLKVQLDKHHKNFEKGIRSKLENAIRPEVGDLWLQLEEIVEDIDHLEKKASGKKSELAIPEENTDELLTCIQSYVQQTFTTDLNIMGSQFDVIEEEIENEIKKANAEHLPINFKHMSADIINTMLVSTVRFDQPYRSEVTNRGFYDYFMAIRRYQMVFFMIIGVAGGGSALKTKAEIMIPLTIILLSVAGYFVSKSVKQERKASEEKELEKAKKAMRSAYKKMVTEANKIWVSKLNDHLKTELKETTRSIEKHLKSHIKGQKNELSTQKQKVKRQMKSLSEKEKELNGYIKESETLRRNIRQIRNSIKQDLNKQLRAIKI